MPALTRLAAVALAALALLATAGASAAAPAEAPADSDRGADVGPPADLPDPVPDFVAGIHDLVGELLDGALGPSVSDAASTDAAAGGEG